MGFLKKFFRNVFRDGNGTRPPSSFETLSEEDLEAHLNIAKYGNYQLTDAIRPAYSLDVVPQNGFRHLHLTDAMFVFLMIFGDQSALSENFFHLSIF